MFVFPVYCTAEVPIPVMEKFLRDALAGSVDLAPGSDYCLAIITRADEVPSGASKPPLQPFASPFLGQSIEDISRQLNGATYFAILDEQSTPDETVILGEHRDGKVETVRVTFYSAQSLLTSFYIGTLGFFEIQYNAAREGGVYKQEKPEARRRGGPAPRKLLESRRLG
ncbi:hypothetical protein F5Y00DRAFT_188735 [Daldinia vernicosa]|uniref:uncharacterized protein n=1 Tax=Daldinia vernicosa TaxID=114800 RepID=UPI0020089A0C|nr:uncharacterized protein F5Y00DRAFT_188735 [Daldinia vernicosa]KAI0844669.1 hypothetical protein F5Y00DRAFT_188735 [Daldinia vernicosa]